MPFLGKTGFLYKDKERQGEQKNKKNKKKKQKNNQKKQIRRV